MTRRPESNEYAPYYLPYINSVPEGDLLQVLDEQMNEINNVLKKISDAEGTFRYAPQKWSIKEVIGHIADTERIMSYRLLCIARGETVSLPGFDENLYVQNASFDRQSIQDLLSHFIAIRKSTLHLLKSLDEEAWLRSGIGNNYTVSVRALAYIIAGHALHHFTIIKERYLASENFPR